MIDSNAAHTGMYFYVATCAGTYGKRKMASICVEPSNRQKFDARTRFFENCSKLVTRQGAVRMKSNNDYFSSVSNHAEAQVTHSHGVACRCSSPGYFRVFQSRSDGESYHLMVSYSPNTNPTL